MDSKRTRIPLTPGRYAAIDIGTVTCRLFVADISESDELSELYRDAVICNLGVGVDKTHRLSADAIERVGKAIEGFNGILADLKLPGQNAIPVSVVATSASRDAENADEFKARLAQAGLDLQVIPGEREAELSFSGASSAFLGEKVVVLDIGGGSTEIIAGEAGGNLQFAHSFNIGCRRVTERYFQQDPPTKDSLCKASDWIDSEFRAYIDNLREKGCFEGRVVAVAGTATSVVSMRENMAEYDSSLVHRAVVSRDDVDELLDKLSCMTVEQRRHVVGLHPDRAPVIVAGLLILQRILQLAGADSFTVSECDILHGIVLAVAQNTAG